MCKKNKNLIQPLIDCELSMSDQRVRLHEMFTLAVSNAPDNEMENFTAKRLSPVYLALCKMLEKVRKKPKFKKPKP